MGNALLRYKSVISFYPEWCFWCQRTKPHYAICGFLTLPNRWYFLVREYHWVGAWQYWLRLLVHKIFERPSVMVGQPLPPISPWFGNSKVFPFPKWIDVKSEFPMISKNFFHFNIIINLQHNILYGIVQRFFVFWNTRASSVLLFPTFWGLSYFFLLLGKIPTFSYFFRFLLKLIGKNAIFKQKKFF